MGGVHKIIIRQGREALGEFNYVELQWIPTTQITLESLESHAVVAFYFCPKI